MKTENTDKPAVVQAIDTLAGTVATILLFVGWSSGIAVAVFTGSFSLLAVFTAILLPPVAFVLYAAHLLGLLS